MAFTLIELLVVISIISVLMGILLPVLAEARRQTKALQCMSNQRQIFCAINLFAADNDGCYPESMATITSGGSWHWQDPRMLTACRPRPGQMHRSISEYLRDYIEDADIMFCPSAPEKYKYLQQSWDACDEWDNPESSFPYDPVWGTYCFYWNYIGYLGAGKSPFRGPRSPAGGRGYSKLLVSDYFGYDHHRSLKAYGSCERFKRATITPGTEASSAYWSYKSNGHIGPDALDIKLHTGYMDGHVESFTPSETVPMRVSITADGSVPYPSGIGLGPGIFYLPLNGLR